MEEYSDEGTQLTKYRSKNTKGVHSKCVGCPAACCHNVTVTIYDRPKLSKLNVDQLNYYLMHNNMAVEFDGTWNLVMLTTCSNLNKDFTCNIYATRPNICRDHTPNDCSEKDLFLHDLLPSGTKLFHNVQEFSDWMTTTEGRKLIAHE